MDEDDQKQVNEAIGVLKSGGVIVFPTDTVWGVGALVSHDGGLHRLYDIKRREANKPTAILVPSYSVAQKYGIFSDRAHELAEKFWPGRLTLVVHARGRKVPHVVRGGSNTVGLRSPRHNLVLGLLRELGEGLVTASANFSGHPAPQTRSEIEPDFLGEVDYVLKGEAGGRSASTVVDVSGENLVLLREGPVIVSGGDRG